MSRFTEQQQAKQLERDIARCGKLVAKNDSLVEVAAAEAAEAQAKNAKRWAKESPAFKDSRTTVLQRLELLVEAEKLASLESDLNSKAKRQEAQIGRRSQLSVCIYMRMTLRVACVDDICDPAHAPGTKREEQKQALDAIGSQPGGGGGGLDENAAFLYNCSKKLIAKKISWQSFVNAVEIRQTERGGLAPQTNFAVDPRLAEEEEGELLIARQDALYTMMNLK